jgi:hypothetical protein
MRPCLDEIDEPHALILKHLVDDLLHASAIKSLTRHQMKLVAGCVLEALNLCAAMGLFTQVPQPDRAMT